MVRSCVTLLVMGGGLLAAAAPHGVAPKNVSGPMRTLLANSMRLSDASYDGAAHLIRRPGDSAEHDPGRYMVRESSWYALGLLMRDGSGDRERAAATLRAVLADQYRTPGVKWFGTFKRSPEEAGPRTGEAGFTSYDPNWRHFIGTTFAMILIEYPGRIPKDLAEQMVASINMAVEGEMQDGRLVPSYSNIALMYGWLWDFAAEHDAKADWKQGAAAWTGEVYRLFKQHDAFFEYNSPTYYGVDLYGLALWRSYGSTSAMRGHGAEMEARLWTDIADFYSPLLRNVSGPYDRSYGMDMESYVSVVGVWMRSALEPGAAPLPKIAVETDHVADVWFAPMIAILGTRVPAEAMGWMRTFKGEHLVTRRIDAERVATAWIGKSAIWGGEATSRTRGVAGSSQFHPATVQWRTPSGKIGWIQLTKTEAIDAVADREGISIATAGDVSFRIVAEGMKEADVAEGRWTLPGMTVEVTTDAAGFAKAAGESGWDVTYRGVKTMRLRMLPEKR